MPLSQTTLEQISENPSHLNKLVLTDKTLNDDDINLLVNTIPKDSHISKIYIRNHNLTPKSYPVLLDLVKSHPNITLLSYKLIMPISVSGSMYNEAIMVVLKENMQEKKKKNEQLILSKTMDQSVKTEELSASGKKQSLGDRVSKLSPATSSPVAPLTFSPMPSPSIPTSLRKELDSALKPSGNHLQENGSKDRTKNAVVV